MRKGFLSGDPPTFYCPRFVFVELFKHKERIAQATALDETDLLECLYELLARVHFVEEGGIPIGTWMEARRLCRGVDPKDAPFVALALHLEGALGRATKDSKPGFGPKALITFSRVRHLA